MIVNIKKEKKCVESELFARVCELTANTWFETSKGLRTLDYT